MLFLFISFTKMVAKLSKTDHPVFRKGFVSFLKPDRYVKRERTARRSGPVFETSRIRVGCRNGFGVNTWQIVMDHPYIVAGSRQIQTLDGVFFSIALLNVYPKVMLRRRILVASYVKTSGKP